MFDVDFREEFEGPPDQTDRLEEALRSYAEEAWGTWAENARPVKQTRIVHLLVTTQVQLGVDEKRGTISIEPKAFVAHRTEIDMLQALQLPGSIFRRRRRRSSGSPPSAVGVGGHGSVQAACGGYF